MPYWLIPTYDQKFRPTGPLVAMYPHIDGYDCILQPIRCGYTVARPKT